MTQIISLPFGLKKEWSEERERKRKRVRGGSTHGNAPALCLHATHKSIRVCPHYCQFICVIYALPPFEGARQTRTHTHTTHSHTLHSDPCRTSVPPTVNCRPPPPRSSLSYFRVSVLNSNQISLQIRHKSGRCCLRSCLLPPPLPQLLLLFFMPSARYTNECCAGRGGSDVRCCS